MQVALERARHGKGPVLLECISYRLGDHTTADDATRYRPASEVKQAFLAAQGEWDEGREQALIGECQGLVQQAVEAFEQAGTQPLDALFDYVYAQWPAALAEQRAMRRERVARREESRHE